MKSRSPASNGSTPRWSSAISIRPGDPVDPTIINSDLLRTYGDGYYEHVDYSLDTLRGRNILRVTPLEKSWGPDYLRYGVNLDTNFKVDSTYNLRLAYQKTWLNRLGGEFLAFGRDRFATAASAWTSTNRSTKRSATSSKPTSRVGNKQSPASIRTTTRSPCTGSPQHGQDLGGASTSACSVRRAGWEETWFKSRLDTGSPLSARSLERYGGWFGRLDLDQTDRLYFPTSGWTSSNEYFDSQAETTANSTPSLSAVHSFGDWVLGSRLSYQGSPSGSCRSTIPAASAAC
jgi:NTE family protein